MIDWWKVAGGALTTIGGFVETVAGGTIATTTGVTGIGAAGGAALMVHGLATTSFGFAQLVDGFAETGKNIPSGPLEATGKGLGGETGETIGKTLDAGIGLISSSPIKNVKTIDKLLPTCAKETKNFGLKQKAKVVKETFDLGSAAKSTNDVIENSIKLLPNPNEVEKQKDDELNKQ